MKAFMSRRDERLPISETANPAAVPGQAHARAAECEARRILAETEPDGPLTASFGIERVAARNCAPNVWTGALADALRTFVEEE